MKIRQLFNAGLILVIALELGACSSSDSSSKQYSEISATISDVTSRVDYEDATSTSTSTEQINLSWAASDKIDVYAGSVSTTSKISPVFTLSSGAGDKSATFTGGLFSGTVTDGTSLYAYVEKTGQTIDEQNSTVTV